MRIVCVAALLLIGAIVNVACAQTPQRNILLIIADDYGIDATRYYPKTDRRVTTPPAPATPVLAKLAADGILFRNARAQPSCSPTRATILTGRYGFRTGIGKPVPKDPADTVPLFYQSEFTLPEALAKAFAPLPGEGYLTSHIGKWHLSRGINDPNDQGWQYFSGPDPKLAGLDDYYRWPKVVNGVPSNATVYATTDQVNDALAEIDKAGLANRNYFIWLALSAPHAPYQLPPLDLTTYDATPPTGAPRRTYYEATIEAMDKELGRLLERVDLATTTVIFLGDNGTPNEVTASPYNADHAKLRVYEQGVKVPMIVAGAAVVAPGREVTSLVNTLDLFPTILRLAGINPADVLPSGTKIDGVSFLPYIANTSTAPIRPWAYADKFDLAYNQKWERAINDSRYKLIERAKGLQWPVREFFDLQTDPYETKNLLKNTLTSTQKKKLNYLDGELDKLLATR